MIVIVDYGRGNLFSLSQALRKIGVEHVVSEDPDAIRRADRVVFPGVGAFGDAMEGLRRRGLVAALTEAARAGTPILGICVGCQLLLSRGEEFGLHEGLDLIGGTVSRLPEPRPDECVSIRIPNVGWRPLALREPGLFGFAETPWMYFVHSFAPFVDRPEDVLGTIAVNGVDVPALIRRENVMGVQFHPEKSGPAGLRLLAGFFETEFET